MSVKDVPDPLDITAVLLEFNSSKLLNSSCFLVELYDPTPLE